MMIPSLQPWERRRDKKSRFGVCNCRFPTFFRRVKIGIKAWLCVVEVASSSSFSSFSSSSSVSSRSFFDGMWISSFSSSASPPQKKSLVVSLSPFLLWKKNAWLEETHQFPYIFSPYWWNYKKKNWRRVWESRKWLGFIRVCLHHSRPSICHNEIKKKNKKKANKRSLSSILGKKKNAKIEWTHGVFPNRRKHKNWIVKEEKH